MEKEHTETSFYNILRNEIQNYNKEGCTFTIYDGLNGHTDEPDYIRLYEDMTDEKLAGVIFTTKPNLLFDTPLFKDILANKNLAKVAHSSPNKFPELPIIDFEPEEMETNILDFLKKENVKKLAVVDLQESLKKGSETTTQRKICKAIKNYDIDLPRCNFQVRHPELAERTDELVEMMLNCKEEQLPDALLIANDALVESATRGIIASGLKIPQDMIVISHCNFPGKPLSNVETSWYGLDVYKFMDLAIDIMKKQHNGLPFDQCNIIHNDYQLISSNNKS
jgi:DNA-binding LacI/PurR family transcriptional regulator